MIRICCKYRKEFQEGECAIADDDAVARTIDNRLPVGDFTWTERSARRESFIVDLPAEVESRSFVFDSSLPIVPIVVDRRAEYEQRSLFSSHLGDI